MEKLISTNLSAQVQSDYLAYSMAVIIGRAIPSLTDGLKPVQRRVLAAMKMLNLKPDGRYMKCARVEGEVMGKYHPHGSAYGAMVTLAAPWNNNLPFIDGHGNFGSSVDGAAASRYTECKLSPFAWDCLLDDSDTWSLTDNYDGSLKEPIELNVKVPALLLNGQDGIGVGYATRIPQHNLRDICAAIAKPQPLTPDFSTGCDIINDDGLANYQKTGVGTLRLRARCEESEATAKKRNKKQLTFTNLPYGSNPEKIGQQIKDGLDKGNIAGITDVRDDSDLTGDRVTVTLKSGVDAQLATRQLYHYTDLETTFTARNLCVDGTKPVELAPSELLSRWTQWRLKRLGAKFAHELDASEARLEIVRGYLKAIDKIDLVIKIIRAAKTPKEALIELVGNRTLKFTGDQARAILDMRLRALTNLDSEELKTEEQTLVARISELDLLIKDEKQRKGYMIKEIKAIGVRYGEKRRSQIIDPPTGLTVEKGSSRKAAPVARPKFLKIDMKRGTIEQAKGPRGAMILEKTDKLITLTKDGTLRKLPPTFKGPLGEGYSEVLLAKKESEVATRKYLVVFTLDNQLKAMAIAGEDLCKVTSKGKQCLPQGGELLYFGEGSYTVPWVNPRKKKVELFPLTTKAAKPGAKGVKVANLADVQ